MALIRFNFQGATPIPQTQVEKDFVADLRARLKVVKSRCVTINEDKPNREDNVFQWHICHHDEGENHPPCEDWQEI